MVFLLNLKHGHVRLYETQSETVGSFVIARDNIDKVQFENT